MTELHTNDIVWKFVVNNTDGHKPSLSVNNIVFFFFLGGGRETKVCVLTIILDVSKVSFELFEEIIAAG